MEAAAAVGAHTNAARSSASAAAAVVRDLEAGQAAAAAAATPTGRSLAGNVSGPPPPRTMEQLMSLAAQMSLDVSSHAAAVAAVERRVKDVVLRTSATAPARAALAAADAAKAGWFSMIANGPALNA